MHDFNTPRESDLEKKYINLECQIKSLIIGEQNSTAILANVAAAISQTFNWLWVGFYLIEDSELVLGPFQGPVACFRIKKGEGVCGTSWKEGKTIIVKDVEKFPGHIACSSFSKSEIVVPIFNKKKIYGVLDIDSDKLNSFSEIDKKYLEKIVSVIENNLM
ncbi:MAG: GAF domain-containing protein [Cytophagales bacterium]|nr:MAG: diguanylate cyclase [Rhodothermaeota bacterium MED-G19]|tara:strand:- start:317 stop:799 length:483 start_codon:yes stop_codon:yes gene_type:complete